jgi:hypothetical protein
MSGETWLHDELRRTLDVLAAPWDDQRRYLERVFGQEVAVDELGLEFDDVAPVALAQGREAGLSDEALSAVRDLDDQLKMMSDRSEARLWTIEGLRDSPDWARVRTLAQAVLSLLPFGAASPVRQR